VQADSRTTPVSQVLTFNCVPELQCPRGHQMTMKETGGFHWTCDQCNADNPGRIKSRLRCDRCDHDVCKTCQKTMEGRLCNLLTSPRLPEVAPDMRKDIGNISAALWFAIEEGRTESYPRLAQGLPLVDRILVKTLHVAENATVGAPGRLRAAMKIEYEEGEHAAEHILRSLSGDDVAAKVHWQIEVQAKRAACSVAGCLRPSLNGQGGELCCRVCLSSRGARHAPACEAKAARDGALPSSSAGVGQSGARPAAAAPIKVLNRPCSSLKVAELKEELQSRGLGVSGKKADLIARLEEAIDAAADDEDNSDTFSDDETLEDDRVDGIQKMIRVGVQGLAKLALHGSSPFMKTPSGALQPNPLALRRMDQLKPWFESAGRLVGCALWSSKTLGVPMARFFARRVLELARTERLTAYSCDGDGPPFFDLVGTTVKIRSHRGDTAGCPEPRLNLNTVTGAQLVIDACTRAGKLFLKCERKSEGRAALPGHQQQLELPGWVPVAQTTAEVKSEEECRERWAQLQRHVQHMPFNGTFLQRAGARAICGQACRVSRKPLVPVFESDEDDHKKQGPEELARAQEQEEASNGRRVQEAQDAALARAVADGLSDGECDKISQAAVHSMLATIEAEKRRATEASICDASPLLAAEHPHTLVLGSNNFPKTCKMEGLAFLPGWAMHALGLQDGQEVSVEPLLLPLNKAGRAMSSRSQAPDFWFCSRKMGRGKCGPGTACADCKAVDAPGVLTSCGMEVAARISWRLPGHHLVGELESVLGSPMQAADMIAKCRLSFIKVPVATRHPDAFHAPLLFFLRAPCSAQVPGAPGGGGVATVVGGLRWCEGAGRTDW